MLLLVDLSLLLLLLAKDHGTLRPAATQLLLLLLRPVEFPESPPAAGVSYTSSSGPRRRGRRGARHRAQVRGALGCEMLLALEKPFFYVSIPRSVLTHRKSVAFPRIEVRRRRSRSLAIARVDGTQFFVLVLVFLLLLESSIQEARGGGGAVGRRRREEGPVLAEKQRRLSRGGRRRGLLAVALVGVGALLKHPPLIASSASASASYEAWAIFRGSHGDGDAGEQHWTANVITAGPLYNHWRGPSKGTQSTPQAKIMHMDD